MLSINDDDDDLLPNTGCLIIVSELFHYSCTVTVTPYAMALRINVANSFYTTLVFFILYNFSVL